MFRTSIAKTGKAATAGILATLAFSHAAMAQPAVIRTSPQAVAARPVPLNPPSNIELQLRINELNARIDSLSSDIAALAQSVNQLKATLADNRKVEDERWRRMRASLLATCKLLYQHHWAPDGVAHPTPSNPYIPDDYCRASPDYVPLPY